MLYCYIILKIADNNIKCFNHKAKAHFGSNHLLLSLPRVGACSTTGCSALNWNLHLLPSHILLLLPLCGLFYNNSPDSEQGTDLVSS